MIDSTVTKATIRHFPNPTNAKTVAERMMSDGRISQRNVPVSIIPVTITTRTIHHKSTVIPVHVVFFAAF